MSSFNVVRLQFLQLHLPASVCLHVWEYQRDHHLFESWVIQQVFSATDSSRKRLNKYFIFNLLKSNVVCNRVLEGAQPCWKQICDSKLDVFDWFDLAFERRGAQRKLWAPVLYIWPKFSLQKFWVGIRDLFQDVHFLIHPCSCYVQCLIYGISPKIP